MHKIFIRISLTVLIFLSFYLSFIIWTNNGGLRKNAVISSKNMTQVDYSRNLTNLYTPIKIFYVDQDSNKNLIPGRTNEVTAEVKRRLKNLNLKKLSAYNVDTNKHYESIIDNNNSVQLYYQSPLSIKILAQVFGFKFDKDIGEFPANRIIIAEVSPIECEIYFANDKTRKYYYSSLNLETDKIFSLAKNAKNRILIKERKSHDNFITLFQSPVPLKSYTYLIKTLDDSYYVSSFMSNDGSAGLTFDSKTNTYKKGLTKTLTIDNKTGTVHFVDYHLEEKDVPHDLTSLLNLSKGVMQIIGNPFNSFRYFSNPEHNRVVFRSYIDGFPVFFSQKNGDISLSWGKTSESLYFANSTLEVPISTSQNSRMLEETDTLIEKLNRKGIATKDIQDIQIGYSMVKNRESTEVVDLLPQYFVKLNGTYRAAATILNQNLGGS
ncbi:YycH family regulatory protein [Xylocopilactobacillus apicola]|uniref:Regulatory protein YycH domain-containing protein n=1 Tax=Xylocopilactobacillus apicola TaxID=2932184 RepID=A0AAU9D8L7_9LACO|nr:hypothetical protein [Xylocopilactobacillus apicola]BDR58685.1 hypothetical protein XA3_11260 [Xylocopilactobacillus apicola]